MTSYQTDIRPLFRDRDIDCMAGHDVYLDDYAYMSNPAGNAKYPDHANARMVHCHLIADGCKRRMPLGGPYWPETQLQLYQQWVDEGCPP